MTTPAVFLDALPDALPMREIKERAGTYGNCGGVAFAYAHIERGTGPGVELVDALEDLPDYAEDWRDLIDALLGYIGEGVRDGFRDALDGAEPPVRVLVYRIDPDPSYANPGNHRRAGRRVAEEALRRACPPTASADDLLRALPMRGIDLGSAEVELEKGVYDTVEVVDAVSPALDGDREARYLAETRVDNVRTGVHSAFRVLFGAEPPVRLVVRRISPAVESDPGLDRRVGRQIVEEVLRRLGG